MAKYQGNNTKLGAGGNEWEAILISEGQKRRRYNYVLSLLTLGGIGYIIGLINGPFNLMGFVSTVAIGVFATAIILTAKWKL